MGVTMGVTAFNVVLWVVGDDDEDCGGVINIFALLVLVALLVLTRVALREVMIA